MMLSMRYGICEENDSFWEEKVNWDLKAVEWVTGMCNGTVEGGGEGDDIYSHLPCAESSGGISCIPSVWGIQKGKYLEGSLD